MKSENLVEKFPSIMETQVLSDNMMSEIESGGDCKSCSPSCKSCKTQKNDVDVDAEINIER